MTVHPVQVLKQGLKIVWDASRPSPSLLLFISRSPFLPFSPSLPIASRESGGLLKLPQ